MVEVFKTNIQQIQQAAKLAAGLLRQFPLYKINFDLHDCDKILRVEGENICPITITEHVTANGHHCKVLE